MMNVYSLPRVKTATSLALLRHKIQNCSTILINIMNEQVSVEVLNLNCLRLMPVNNYLQIISECHLGCLMNCRGGDGQLVM